MIGFVVSSLALALSGPSGDTTTDPAFLKMKGMVGGVWVGDLGKKMIIRFTYELKEEGKMLEGHGQLSNAGKVILTMNSKFGWDPIAKKTYYVDFHGHDVVYQGHVTLQKDRFVIDFQGLIGDLGHWVSYAQMPTKDRYDFEMFQYKGKKLVPTHLDVRLHREAI